MDRVRGLPGRVQRPDEPAADPVHELDLLGGHQVHGRCKSRGSLLASGLHSSKSASNLVADFNDVPVSIIVADRLRQARHPRRHRAAALRHGERGAGGADEPQRNR